MWNTITILTIGALAGILYSGTAGFTEKFGRLDRIILGILGAGAGGLVFGAIGMQVYTLPASLVMAILGAFLLLGTVNLIISAIIPARRRAVERKRARNSPDFKAAA